MTSVRIYLTSVLAVLMLLCVGSVAHADNAAFDLSGPRIEVKVTREGKSLPIAEVPNLQPGDRLWVHPLFPKAQSVHYLLIVAFLRGSTNPPPENWFTKAETWSKQVREEGILITIPQDAQQAVLFLAPETGGDFGTLRAAVRGKPGAFVRAGQDLERLSLDRSRLDKYLAAVEDVSNNDPNALHERSILLARSLNIRLDHQCFDKPTEQQAPCLTQNTDQLVLDDAHSQSMVSTLTSGPSADLIGAISVSPALRGGYYSPYVGAVVDVARIMGTIHTAQYQYIPALARPEQYELNLKLNNPPSFRKPKSVLVLALPPVESPRMPPMRAVDPDQLFCLQSSPLVLPVEGAPLVFSTELAHDFTLRLRGKADQEIDLPAKADARRGGFVIDSHGLQRANLDSAVTGTLHGYWGFNRLVGPTFQLRSASAGRWSLSDSERRNVVVGREATFHLESSSACCVEQVAIKDQHGNQLKTSWNIRRPEQVEVKVPLEDATPGPATISLKQFGLDKADEIPLYAYSEPARLDSFLIYSGDQEGVLKGERLDEVAGLELNGSWFSPREHTRADQKDEINLATSNPAAAALRSSEKLSARVSLKDGRILNLETTVEPPRPKLALVSKNVQPGPASASAIHLGSEDDLPQDGRLSFVIKTQVPASFPRAEKIEVATADDSFDVLLSLSDGSLVLQDSETVLATIDPLKAFGPSAFGPIRFRAVDSAERKGDWQPLTKLVRLPTLKEIRCPQGTDQPSNQQCTLTGANLFLIDSIASDPQFAHTIPVPPGFVDSSLSVPRPDNGPLYLKLRDDPSAVDTTAIPVLPAKQ